MHGRLLHIVVAGAVVWGFGATPSAQAPRPQDVRQVLERLAGRIKVLGPGDFINGFREDWELPERYPLQREFARFAEGGGHGADDLLPLLRHRNPKVRTLALISLYCLDDPQVLPTIFPLVTDKASTFKTIRQIRSASSFPPVRERDLVESQTVGDVATAIMNAYLLPAGYKYGPLGGRDEPGFEHYWKLRADRASTAGWWHARLARAGFWTSLAPERQEAIRAVRGRMDRVAEPDRTFTLLSMQGVLGARVMIPDEEVIAPLQALGPAALVDLLRRRVPSDDPDLQPSPHEPESRLFNPMRAFVLRHAGAVLRPQDSAVLLEQETWERAFLEHHVSDPLITPWWAIGAAQLNPAGAVSILERAYSRFQGQYDGPEQLMLARELWRLGGDGQAPTVADWIYRELARPFMEAEARTVRDLLQIGGMARGRIMARALIEDPRFDELNWKSLEVLARAMNGWTGRPIVPEEELKSARSPTGIDFFMKDKAKALEQYPKEVGELVGRLDRWRAALRDAIREP